VTLPRASVVLLGLLHLTTLVQVASKLALVMMSARPEPALATALAWVTLPRAS